LLSFLFITVFAGYLAAAVLGGKLPALVPAFYLAASIVTLAVYALDKRAACSGRWRTPEATLHLLAVIGGWPGALISQKLLHHKTKKQPFRAFFFLTIVINCAALAYLSRFTT
jgi:uncharacterized membrane protein YsdA (DUF1294 family)